MYITSLYTHFFFNSWMIRRFSKYVAKEKNILTLSLDINTLAMSTNNDRKKKKKDTFTSTAYSAPISSRIPLAFYLIFLEKKKEETPRDITVIKPT